MEGIITPLSDRIRAGTVVMEFGPELVAGWLAGWLAIKMHIVSVEVYPIKRQINNKS